MKDVLELALDALKAYRDRGSMDDLEEAGYAGDGAISMLESAIKAKHESALVKFTSYGGYDETDPIERLRFFCSLAMQGKDWLDVEQFFDAIKQRGEPVNEHVAVVVFAELKKAGRFITPQDEVMVKNAVLSMKPLYTTAPTIPKGWQLVPIEATFEMLKTCRNTPYCGDVAYFWKAMLSAAPEYKGEPDWSTTKKWGE